ncbi:MAG: C4-dicarboxylate transporter DctA [Myxococcales bacterium]|nr:MAG: C4-dicarboxylate transporter DctA [Myxococcales bacterium]
MRKLVGGLYGQVVLAIVAGVLIGHYAPATAVHFKPLGDGFLRLIKMLIAPLVFATIVAGMTGMGDLKKVGRVGAKALLYFEILTTVALLIGLAVVKIVRPGAGLHVDATHLDQGAVESYTTAAKHQSTADFLLNIIPSNVVEAFSRGEILQVLLFAVLFGAAAAALGSESRPVIEVIDRTGKVLLKIVSMVMKLAPLGAFGAMAYTVGRHGVGALAGLGKLMGAFYLTAIVFVMLVLGGVMRLLGLRITRLLRSLSDELLIVLGTSSSEAALPRLMEKLEALGCSRGVVGLVVPTGYSFNLDGTSIYLTMAALFVAQATDTSLSFGQELSILLVLLLTSKGAATVTGGGFITLAATLSSTGTIPVAGLGLLLGIDRFMSEARALTNLVGNAVATLVIARWEGELDLDRAREQLGPR